MALLVLRGISFDIMITLVLFRLVKLLWERIDMFKGLAASNMFEYLIEKIIL